MEPQIRFCTSADGTRIAYATLGEGPPLVRVPGWAASQEREWTRPDERAFFEDLGRGRLLVTFDRRGVGASQREVADLSLEAQVADVEALVDHLQLGRFGLFGVAEGAAISAAYAAQHPGRVSRLVLWSAYSCGEEIAPPGAVQGLVELIRRNWGLARRAISDVIFPTGPTERQRWFSNGLRESVSPESAARHVEFFASVDARPYLSQVKSPTLVLHRRGDRNVPVSAGRAVAALIPDARFVAFEGTSPTVVMEDMESVLSTIDDFLSEGEEAEPKAELPEGMAVLLFTDIAESTALTEQLGDAAFRAKARELDTSLRSVIKESGGTPVEGKVLGDGVLAVFTSARQAIDCALRSEAAGGPLGLQLHLGIHAGDVIREGNNVYGGAVNIAARIAAASEPGEVLVSDTVRSLGRTSADVTFDDRGEHTLKGVGEPQRLFAVRGGG